MKLSIAAVIAFAATSALALSIPYKQSAVYAREMYERDSGEGALESFEKRTRVKHDPAGQVNTGGYATYFYQKGNPGACGTVHSDDDLIAAIDSTRYGSALCGKQVKITNPSNGKSVVVKVADNCPTCRNADSIDLSVAAFKNIADTSQGIVGINWVFV
ncbi:hypothetical protein M378DRAFT_10942 [Amanita muscaria Koide BX008]|uniref:RlpA-like protein double-psi beta-barrel domain-containing protein n=1 Tax=Amanita muscaria (strain Koide BX008) TaxID=946122 RepID=A0A0C2X980_AMAMK|nr:hypothetical protein M378DRAFT_10942 [Amanita muscaria Koide BX008]